MSFRHAVCNGFFVAAMAGLCFGADWPEWRGPGRDGVVRDSPPLMDAFPDGGPREVWRCKDIPGHDLGGYGSVSVAAGRVYVYANTRVRTPQPEKVLTKAALEAMGWIPDLPEALWTAVDEARVSPERVGLAADKVEPWVKDWLAGHLSADTKTYEAKLTERLKQGQSAMPLPVLRALAAVRDKKFAGEPELRDWFTAEAIPANWHATVIQKAAVVLETGFDDIFCVDAETGKLLWTQRYPGQTYPYQCSSTPCLAEGRCYVGGSAGSLYCLDAVTGAEVWKGKSKAGPKQQVGGSFVVQDGVAVLLGGSLMGFDAASGRVLWTQDAVKGLHASPARWRRGDRTYLICNGSMDAVCVDPQTGTVLWKVPGGGPSTPVLCGDVFVLYTPNAKTGLAAYRLSETAPQQLWKLPYTDRGASPVIHEGFVYIMGGWQKPHAVCVELESGKVAWEVKTPAETEISSPVVADGKIWHVFGMSGHTSLYCLRATPEKYTLLGTAPIPAVTATSPAIADGRIYLRLPDAVVCYDLRR